MTHPPLRLPDARKEFMNEETAFIEAKIVEAEKVLNAREQMRDAWAGGSDESWRLAGCTLTKERRLEHSATHGRIAAKNRRELEMFKAVLKRLTDSLPTAASPAP